MFEDRCLVCGYHLADNGRAYCSNHCEHNDLNSPGSVWSSSSSLSSPQLAYGDVPVHIPSALGSPLRSYSVNKCSSSSSSSSASWSFFDDEDQETSRPYSSSSDCSYNNPPDALFEPSMKVQNMINSLNPSALSYTRVPSGTNNRSLVPRLEPRSRCTHVQGFSASAPIWSHVHPDDSSSSEGDISSTDPLDSDSELDSNFKRTLTSKKSSAHNRSSLPACFSLLQIASPSSKSICLPPTSCSSDHATVRHSPLTPTLPSEHPSSTLELSPTVVPLSSHYNTPRGRRREAGYSSCGNRSGDSSRSSTRRRRRLVDGDASAQNDVQQPFEWCLQGIPPANIRARPITLMDDSSILNEVDVRKIANHSKLHTRVRGRTRIEDLEGVGHTIEAPGYGSGRSGLVNRELCGPLRIPL